MQSYYKKKKVAEEGIDSITGTTARWLVGVGMGGGVQPFTNGFYAKVAGLGFLVRAPLPLGGRGAYPSANSGLAAAPCP